MNAEVKNNYVLAEKLFRETIPGETWNNLVKAAPCPDQADKKVAYLLVQAVSNAGVRCLRAAAEMTGGRRVSCHTCDQILLEMLQHEFARHGFIGETLETALAETLAHLALPTGLLHLLKISPPREEGPADQSKREKLLLKLKENCANLPPEIREKLLAELEKKDVIPSLIETTVESALMPPQFSWSMNSLMHSWNNQESDLCAGINRMGAVIYQPWPPKDLNTSLDWLARQLQPVWEHSAWLPANHAQIEMVMHSIGLALCLAEVVYLSEAGNKPDAEKLLGGWVACTVAPDNLRAFLGGEARKNLLPDSTRWLLNMVEGKGEAMFQADLAAIMAAENLQEALAEKIPDWIHTRSFRAVEDTLAAIREKLDLPFIGMNIVRLKKGETGPLLQGTRFSFTQEEPE